MEKIINNIRQLLSNISTVQFTDVLDIVIVAAIIYFIIGLIRRTNAHRVFLGILVFLFTFWLSGQVRLYTLNYMLRTAAQLGLLALVILFQPEIRRFLEKLGRTGSSFWRMLGTRNYNTTESVISHVVMACADMSASRTGALIIFERDNPVDEQIRTGTIVDAQVTAELLKNIFYPKAPLHDGAAIIRNGRIQAAGCMLPLSSNPNLSRELGMRHRAGIGMSEASDALVVIVSEETGAISVAEGGMLKRHLSKETFEKILRTGLITEEEKTGFQRFRKKKKEG
jgi:diadenylate cyclase